ncbi:hypothetical protein BAUCODRAFT_80695, partial [Baudoinia panamericana UAMH 10762]
LQWAPPAVSFETKRSGESLSEAILQLDIWALAQVKKLTELLSLAGRPSTPIPALPLVIIQGEDWTVRFLEINVEQKQATLWSKITFADTTEHRGVYQAVTGLQALLKWAAEEYRAWFVENIIRPLSQRVRDG